MNTGTRGCLSCNKDIKGRIDKKFCDDYCRSAYNNQRNSCGNNYIRNINHALLRNRRILEELLPASAVMVKTTRQQLYFKGFQFGYFTHILTNKKGNTYYFCYDHGYLLLPNDRLMLVRRKKEVPAS
ncbi:MAG: hypothetical protein NVSMB63_05400 [Sediminibacterium sp.]